MKKVLCVVLLVIFASTCFAGEMGAKGAKLGLNFANISGDDAEYNSSLMGFAIGGFITYNLNDKMSIQPELYYTMKGYKIEMDFFGLNLDFDVNLNYLEIPVLFKYHFMADNSFNPAVYAGPYLGILLSAEADGEDIKDGTKSTDFGLCFGLGGEYNKFTFEFRYGMGLTSLDDSDEEAKIKNSNMQFLFGYKF